MKIEFELSGLIDASPEIIYKAWLNSEEHSAMTGGDANVSDKVGEGFEAWDGYISGVNLELKENQRILQHWRTSEFEDSDEDSLLEILLEAKNGGTFITLKHSNLPPHGMQYKEGWVDNYFNPMNEYLGNKS